MVPHHLAPDAPQGASEPRLAVVWRCGLVPAVGAPRRPLGTARPPTGGPDVGHAPGRYSLRRAEDCPGRCFSQGHEGRLHSASDRALLPRVGEQTTPPLLRMHEGASDHTAAARPACGAHHTARLQGFQRPGSSPDDHPRAKWWKKIQQAGTPLHDVPTVEALKEKGEQTRWPCGIHPQRFWRGAVCRRNWPRSRQGADSENLFLKSYSKNEIWSAKVSELVRRAAEFGTVTGPRSVDMARVRQRKRDMVDSLITLHLDRFKASGAELIMGAGISSRLKPSRCA